VAAVLLGLFFIYAGGKKLFFPAPRPEGISTVPQEFIDLIRALKATGYYMEMVGWFQLIAGILLLYRPTMLIGAWLLAPVTFNIFTIHLALDNRWDEYVLTGVLFTINAWIVLYYIKNLWLKRVTAPVS
jgi:hypothetical protein